MTAPITSEQIYELLKTIHADMAAMKEELSDVKSTQQRMRENLGVGDDFEKKYKFGM